MTLSLSRSLDVVPSYAREMRWTENPSGLSAHHTARISPRRTLAASPAYLPVGSTYYDRPLGAQWSEDRWRQHGGGVPEPREPPLWSHHFPVYAYNEGMHVDAASQWERDNYTDYQSRYLGTSGNNSDAIGSGANVAPPQSRMMRAVASANMPYHPIHGRYWGERGSYWPSDRIAQAQGTVLPESHLNTAVARVRHSSPPRMGRAASSTDRGSPSANVGPPLFDPTPSTRRERYWYESESDSRPWISDRTSWRPDTHRGLPRTGSFDPAKDEHPMHRLQSQHSSSPSASNWLSTVRAEERLMHARYGEFAPPTIGYGLGLHRPEAYEGIMNRYALQRSVQLDPLYRSGYSALQRSTLHTDGESRPYLAAHTMRFSTDVVGTTLHSA